MAGLDAWVFSRPYGNASGGGDVYYVSSCATGRITRLLVADGAGVLVTDLDGQACAALAKELNGQRPAGRALGCALDVTDAASWDDVTRLARRRGRWSDPLVRQAIVRVLSEERIRGWTNQRVRAGLRAKVRFPVPLNVFNSNGDGTYTQVLQAAPTASATVVSATVDTVAIAGEKRKNWNLMATAPFGAFTLKTGYNTRAK